MRPACLIIQVVPRRIVLADEVRRPVAPLYFELLLAANGILDATKVFEMYQSGHPVLLHEVGAFPGAVLVDTTDNVAGDADVERAVGFASPL